MAFLLRGHTPIPAAFEAMKILEGQNELGIKTSQVIQAHTIIKSLVPKYRGKAVLVLGGIGDSVRRVAESYGLDAYTPLDILAWESTSVNITHIRESGTYLILYLSYNRISPFHTLTKEEQSTTPGNFSTTPIHAVIVFHDPRNWLLDTQVVCDVLQGRYVEPSLWEKMKKANPSPVDLIFCNPDLIWRAAFPQPRLGQGGFITAFQAVYQIAEMERTDPNHIETPPIYMIGGRHRSNSNIFGYNIDSFSPDNPASDIAGGQRGRLGIDSYQLATSTQQGGFPMQLVFKCENLQKVGAFKFRGATNAILQILRSHTELDPSSLTVVTHSSGNHAQALAYAARSVGARACIVMPSNATPAKIDAVRGYGAAVTLCEPILSAREETMYRGTMAVEFLEQAEQIGRPLDVIITPVGGGGMLSGCSLAATGLKPGIKVVGAEPAGSGDAYESFKTKTWVPSVNPQTFCDGLLTSTGKLTFPIILDHVDAICMATEEQIARAMKFVWERMKLVIEPSAAVPLAVVFYSPEFHEAAARWSADKQAGLNIGIVISGGNVNMQAALNIINSAKMDQSPVAVATKWFEAYSAGNFEAMKSLAADGYTFEDPAFGKLEGDRALGMYKMFTSTRDKTEAVWNVHEVKPSESDPQRAIVQFEAIYKFNGRPVTNQITSNILVVDGKVKEQVDSFDVPKWAGETPVLSGGSHW
ncbi:Pyridoxal-phosphate dependent enzyme [Rhizoctonia solani]|uniref:Pyridoxal-phosphate dependent enzyme n=1 Tax=Rhizoctonia solani TaxID=456999 RepID=A0A8H7IJL3_9AGAM|nr:Pyridoxal-phosphate dependent enzyme [Rhizoctonia solani]